MSDQESSSDGENDIYQQDSDLKSFDPNVSEDQLKNASECAKYIFYRCDDRNLG